MPAQWIAHTTLGAAIGRTEGSPIMALPALLRRGTSSASLTPSHTISVLSTGTESMSEAVMGKQASGQSQKAGAG